MKMKRDLSIPSCSLRVLAIAGDQGTGGSPDPERVLHVERGAQRALAQEHPGRGGAGHRRERCGGGRASAGCCGRGCSRCGGCRRGWRGWGRRRPSSWRACASHRRTAQGRPGRRGGDGDFAERAWSAPGTVTDSVDTAIAVMNSRVRRGRRAARRNRRARGTRPPRQPRESKGETDVAFSAVMPRTRNGRLRLLTQPLAPRPAVRLHARCVEHVESRGDAVLLAG